MDLTGTLIKIRNFLGDKEILVLYGGRSSEMEASFKTGKRIADCLNEFGFRASLLDPEQDREKLVDRAREVGLVFLGLHGGYGEDGTIQGLLDFWHVPYTGSGILGSCVGMNKLVTKRILKSEGLPTAKYVVCNECTDNLDFVNKSENELGYPLMLKVWDEGSGNGVFMIESREEFMLELAKVRNTYKLFSEKFVGGREISAGVIESDGKIVVLPILEALYDAPFFNMKVRSNPKKYRKDIPAKLEREVRKQVEDVCRYAHKILGSRVYSRIDMKLEKQTNIPYILEVTTLPGLTETSWLPEMAKMGKIDFSELVSLIISSTIDKYESENI